MSRKAHAPTPETRSVVKGLLGCGFLQDETGKIMGIDPKTLRKHYRPELEVGNLTANAAVAQALFKRATNSTGKDSIAAAIFWLKARAGWSDKQQVEITDKRFVALMPEPAPDVDTWLRQSQRT